MSQFEMYVREALARTEKRSFHDRESSRTITLELPDFRGGRLQTIAYDFVEKVPHPDWRGAYLFEENGEIVYERRSPAGARVLTSAGSEALERFDRHVGILSSTIDDL